MSAGNGKPSQQLKWIGDHFDDFQKNGDGWKACCPVHDDSSPSLSLKDGDNGGVLLHCHVGCPIDPILDIAGLRMADLMPGAKPRPARRRRRKSNHKKQIREFF